MNKRFKQWSGWIFVVLWMGVIFYLSHQPAEESSALSSGIGEQIIAIFETISSQSLSNIDGLHYFIRKGAHLFAYFLLAILLMHAQKQMGWRGVKQMLGTLIISILYATSDEIHQLFISGRSGEVTDVVIDTIGASLGILVYVTIAQTIRFFRQRKRSA